MTMGTRGEPVSMKLRVTEAFRRVGGKWQLVHRHADPHADPMAEKQGSPAKQERKAG